MLEDNTPTVTARRRKPSEKLRLRLETARRLQSLNARTKAKRAASKLKKGPNGNREHKVNIAPRVPKVRKYKLSHPAMPSGKFKKRQLGKDWLPTHEYYAKRARMTDPNEPLWRFAIPWTPTGKSYRSTHRASGARGAIAWDMSYMSTIGLEGVEESLEATLRGLGINGQDAWGTWGRRWRAGTRALEAWTREPDTENKLLAPVTIVWRAPEKNEDVEMADAGDAKEGNKPETKKMFMRVHPSAFLQLWDEVLKLAKAQNPPVMVEDLRFELGSIDIAGAGSTEALMAALKPTGREEWPENSPEAMWQLLAGFNADSLPIDALLAFNVSDPRLHHPPKTTPPQTSESAFEDITRLLCTWSPDSTQSQPSIFSRPDRLRASRSLPNQKAINRRRTIAPAGEYPSPKPSDPSIPVLILARRSPINVKEGHPTGFWTVILPWKCVLPVWHSIMHYPLSSGGNPLFGGLMERQQVLFEAGDTWFPGDFPGTKAGWVWELREREYYRKKWERKPKGKRIEFDSLNLGGEKKGEIGLGWGCDWERLIQGQAKEAGDKKDSGIIKADRGDSAHPDGVVNLPSGPDEPQPSTTENTNTASFPDIIQLSSRTAESIFTTNPRYSRSPSEIQSLLADKTALMTVQIKMKGRGTPNPHARIYRLPQKDHSLREQWILHGAFTNARGLTRPKGDKELPLPGEEDLIGFITTGNYNLHEAKGTGIGSLWVQRVFDSVTSTSQATGVDNNGRKRKDPEGKLCVIRNAGEDFGRLARWEIV